MLANGLGATAELRWLFYVQAVGIFARQDLKIEIAAALLYALTTASGKA
jgi:hypothetical protein